jgi:hypothetical protein
MARPRTGADNDDDEDDAAPTANDGDVEALSMLP